MSCRPVRYTPVRYTPMRCRQNYGGLAGSSQSDRYTAMSCTPVRYK